MRRWCHAIGRRSHVRADVRPLLTALGPSDTSDGDGEPAAPLPDGARYSILTPPSVTTLAQLRRSRSKKVENSLGVIV